YFFSDIYAHHRHLHSFPTRRSSDLNESAHYALYMMWPDEFQVAKLDYQIEWLNFLKKGFGAPAYGSGFPFVSITLNEYSCNNDADRKSTRLNSSHVKISYAVFCLKK